MKGFPGWWQIPVEEGQQGGPAAWGLKILAVVAQVRNLGQAGKLGQWAWLLTWGTLPHPLGVAPEPSRGHDC